jgi:hypothetical protein
MVQEKLNRALEKYITASSGYLAYRLQQLVHARYFSSTPTSPLPSKKVILICWEMILINRVKSTPLIPIVLANFSIQIYLKPEAVVISSNFFLTNYL